jgi:hypothetical protein
MAAIEKSNLFETLLQINNVAFGNGQFDVAYHALAGALHAARDTGNEPGLREVTRLAEEQIADIDTHHPEYHHSTASATLRGHDSIFRMLARNSTARERLTHMENMKELHEAQTQSIR